MVFITAAAFVGCMARTDPILTHTTVIATIVTPWHRALLQDDFILTSAGADNLVLADDRHNLGVDDGGKLH